MSFNFFSKSSAPVLPDALAARLRTWQGLAPPNLNQAHYQTRYVVLEVATSGLDPEQHELTAVAALGLSQGRIRPGDAFLFAPGKGDAESWLGFLEFIGKAPLLSYQVPVLNAFLEPALKRELDVDFKPAWLDLGILLPELFRDAQVQGMNLEAWLEYFEIQMRDSADAMANALALARLSQRLLAAARGRGGESPAALLEQARARRWLHGDA